MKGKAPDTFWGPMKLVRRNLLIALAAAAGLGLWTGLAYYKLVKYSGAVPAAWALVEKDLQARYDRIPGLLARLKAEKYGHLTRLLLEGKLSGVPKPPEAGFALQTAELRDRIVRSRTSWNQAKSRKEKIAVAPALDSALCELESLLDAMSDANYSRLNNNIPWVIELYNREAASYNGVAGSFPGNILARLSGMSGSEDYMAALPSWFYGSAADGKQ